MCALFLRYHSSDVAIGSKRHCRIRKTTVLDRSHRGTGGVGSYWHIGFVFYAFIEATGGRSKAVGCRIGARPHGAKLVRLRQMQQRFRRENKRFSAKLRTFHKVFRNCTLIVCVADWKRCAQRRAETRVIVCKYR